MATTLTPSASSVEGELALTLGEMLALLAQCEAPEDSDTSALLTDEVQDTVRQSIAEKLRRYQGFFSFCDAQAYQCNEEIARLQARKKAIEGGKDRLRKYLARAMDGHRIKRLDAGTCVFQLTQGARSLQVTDEEAIPYKYKVEEIVCKIDKPALKRAIEAGEVIEGAEVVVGDPFVTVR